jgi:WD40 repeat protein
VQYDEDNERVFTASADGTIKIFTPHEVYHPYLGEANEFRCRQTIQAYQGLTTRMDPTIFGASLAIRKLSSKALLSSWEGYLRVLDIEYGRFLASWLAHEKTVSATWTIRQGSEATAPWLVATGSSDRSIRLFDLRAPPKLRKPSPFYSNSSTPANAVMEFKNLEGTVLCLTQQRSNDNILAAGGRFKSISLFDLRSPAGSSAADIGATQTATNPSGALKHLFVGAYTYALLPDPLFANCLYSGSGDRRGAILDRWQLDSNTILSSGHSGLISRLRGPQTPHRSFIFAIASRDDQMAKNSTAGGSLVTASWDGVVCLWDPAATCNPPDREEPIAVGSPTSDPMPTTANDPKVRRAIVQSVVDQPGNGTPTRTGAPAGQSASFTGLALGRTRILASHFGGVACLDLSPRFFHKVASGEAYSFNERDVWEDEDEEDFHVIGRDSPAWMRPGYGMRSILGRVMNAAAGPQGGQPPATTVNA